MELRQANPRRQGDIGEAYAIKWLAQAGYRIYIPFGHSPDTDLIAESDDGLFRIQVKTCTSWRKDRFEVSVCTNGGNQSWSGKVKLWESDRCDFLFVLVADGRQWFIPADAVKGTTKICLGGPKYSEFEVAPAS